MFVFLFFAVTRRIRYKKEERLVAAEGYVLGKIAAATGLELVVCFQESCFRAQLESGSEVGGVAVAIRVYDGRDGRGGREGRGERRADGGAGGSGRSGGG